MRAEGRGQHWLPPSVIILLLVFLRQGLTPNMKLGDDASQVVLAAARTLPTSPAHCCKVSTFSPLSGSNPMGYLREFENKSYSLQCLWMGSVSIAVAASPPPTPNCAASTLRTEPSPQTEASLSSPPILLPFLFCYFCL